MAYFSIDSQNLEELKLCIHFIKSFSRKKICLTNNFILSAAKEFTNCRQKINFQILVTYQISATLISSKTYMNTIYIHLFCNLTFLKIISNNLILYLYTKIFQQFAVCIIEKKLHTHFQIFVNKKCIQLKRTN